MKYRKIYFYVSLSLFVCGLILLFIFPSVLLIPFNNENPIGNILLWPMVVAYPMSIFFGFKSLLNPKNEIEIVFSRIIKSLILLCLLWMPINYLIAGNLSFNFNGTYYVFAKISKQDIFWDYNYFIAGAPFSFLVLYSLYRWFANSVLSA